MTVQDCNEALNLQTGVTFENYVNQGGLLNKTHFNLLNKMQEDSNPV